MNAKNKDIWIVTDYSAMNKAYLLIGGNMGNREEMLAGARELLAQKAGMLVRQSGLYETDAWGKEDQAAFLNQALELDTALSARQLMRLILRLEKKLGRAREEMYGPRLIDIDILLFNNEIHADEFLSLPHPELPNRRFALVPLIEIAPKLVHPQLNLTMTELLSDCADRLEVRKF